MVQLNTPDTRHGNKIEVYEGLVVAYNSYPSITDIDKTRLAKIKNAISIVDALDAKLDLYGPCNMYYQYLPRGLSLRELWRSKEIFINFCPVQIPGLCGWTDSTNRDITIFAWCLDTQRPSMAAATIIHELAHVAGAPGGNSHMAERAVKKCGFDAEYDPKAVGTLDHFANSLARLG